MRSDALPDAQFGVPGPYRDKLVAEILVGSKTATTGLLACYECEGQPLPQQGERSAVIDSAGHRVAVIEVTSVRVLRLADVDEAHALAEGRDHTSVADWRAAHEPFWQSAETRQALGNPDFTVDDDTLIVAEAFRIVETDAGDSRAAGVTLSVPRAGSLAITSEGGERMRQRTIGTVTVSAIGLGGLALSIDGRPDEESAIATIHAALDAGMTLIDTADSYYRDPGETGHNERLIAKALARWGGDRGNVLVATKGGHVRLADSSLGVDGSPEHLRRAAEASLKALGTDVIGLYQFHRPDPGVPYAESIGALRELLDAGKIRMAGISNASIAQIDMAREILGGANLASVQNQFSPAFRSSEAELAHCERLGIAFLPWSPLGGIGEAKGLGCRHAAFGEVAAAHGVSPQRVALAWMLGRSDVLIPIPGASRPESATDSAAAADLALSPDEIATLDAAKPVDNGR